MEWNTEGRQEKTLESLGEELTNLGEKLNSTKAYLNHLQGTSVDEGGGQTYKVKSFEEVLEIIKGLSAKFDDLNIKVLGTAQNNTILENAQNNTFLGNAQNNTCLQNRDIYYLIYKFPNGDWNHFMRILQLSDEDRVTSVNNAHGDIIEGKFQMLQKWMMGFRELKKIAAIKMITDALRCMNLDQFAQAFEKACSRLQDSHSTIW